MTVKLDSGGPFRDEETLFAKEWRKCCKAMPEPAFQELAFLIAQFTFTFRIASLRFRICKFGSRIAVRSFPKLIGGCVN